MSSDFEQSGMFGDNEIKVIAENGATGIGAPELLGTDEPDLSGEFGILALTEGDIKVGNDDDWHEGNVGVIYPTIPGAVAAGVSLLLSSIKAIELADEQGADIGLSDAFVSAMLGGKQPLSMLGLIANLEAMSGAMSGIAGALNDLGDFDDDATLADLIGMDKAPLELPELSETEIEEFNRELDEFLGA